MIQARELTIHDEVREARLAANLTVSEVARRAGVPRKHCGGLPMFYDRRVK